MNEPEETRTLRITGLAAGGDGLGRLEDGRVVFVEGGVPGDLVELADLRLGKRMANARVARVVEASPDRRAPRCAHFGRCGGCAWQHIRYAAQLEAKRGIVRDALERIGGLDLDGEIEIIGSPNEYAYRARARLVEAADGFGYRRRASREIEVATECPILVPVAEEKIRTATTEKKLGRKSARPKGKGRSDIEWELLAGSSGEVQFHPVVRRSGRSSAEVAAERSSDAIELEVLGEHSRASAGSFVQGNALLWEALATEVRDQCGPAERFVELYCGIGFLTLPLARAGCRGTVYESDRSALADLTANLERAGLADQIEVVAGRVEQRGDWAARFVDADVLLVDPPRIGLEASLREAIAASGPPRVVYVSCDPATLARDLRELVAAGYRVAHLRALDLFPQTAHVEVVARLERISPASVEPNPA